MKKLNKSLFGILALSPLFFSCETDENQKIDSKNWELVWSDEFNDAANTSPDATKWTYDIGRGNSGWGNNELQYYTNRTDNVATDGEGNLVITAKSESYNGAPFTSARIKTYGLFEQTYGRFEARLITPYGPGIWPAFWMLGSNYETSPWPQCGEIDIMELRGQEPSTIHGTVHGPDYSAGNAITASYSLQNSRFDTAYHIYAIEWTEDTIDYYVDDYLYQRISKSDVTGDWVYDHPFFIILNIAVGGNYVGFPTADTTYPQTMVIDYVRVYKQI